MDEITTKMPNINTIINLFIQIVYKWHTKILSLNDKYEAQLSDKELHFLVIGISGLVLMIIFFIIFKWFERHKLTILSAWVTTFIVLVSVSFAIEIAQGMSNTGDMDFKDIVAGLAGYFVFSGILLIIALIVRIIIYIIRRNRNG